MPLNDQGQEIPDDTPLIIELPGLSPSSQVDDIQRMIREHYSRLAAEAELETFEDANDFDVDDDEFPVSPHEYREDTERADLEALEAGRLAAAPKPDTGKPVSGAPPAEGPPPPPPPPAAPPPQ